MDIYLHRKTHDISRIMFANANYRKVLVDGEDYWEVCHADGEPSRFACDEWQLFRSVEPKTEPYK